MEKRILISTDQTTDIIKSIINFHLDYFYSFLPCILYWKDEKIHYKNKNLKFYLERSINIKTKRFVILKFKACKCKLAEKL